MTVYADTSVIIAALLVAHPGHAKARPFLVRARAGEIRLAISSHTLAEAYATLTVLPGVPRLKPTDVQKLLENDVIMHADVVSLTSEDYRDVLGRLVSLGLVSGAIYDALHVRAAEKAGADELVTFNGRDFRRMPPKAPCRLVIL